MTIRLVALMSVVLLLSLAAFGLTIGHYQDQVMQEVARTASEVGRATLRTFELDSAPGHAGDLDPAGSALMVWHGRFGDAATTPASAGVSTEREVVVRRVLPEPEAEVRGKRVEVVASAIRASSGEASPPGPGVVTCETSTTGSGPPAQNRFIIRIDDVHAVSDPQQGLVLAIPRFAPAGTAETAGAAAPAASEVPTAPPFGEPASWSRHEEIRLPIPVEDYETLFGSLRRRSAWLFLGVFLVGTVLSAGLASRFTRPVRRLDAALRRLSEGDLDVRVDTRGEHEMARLGRAFNDMTRSLRASRERAREMVRREKHSALGRLAAGVAHDIRNPLHSIGLTLQHLSETSRPESAERAEEFDRSLETIRGEIRRLDRLVGNFLGFARTETRERHPVDLRELLLETARLIRKEAEWRHVEVSLAAGEAVPAFEADGEAIRSSILNLVLNSFEAMPEGGRLGLRLGVEGAEAVLEVSDTGRGIAGEDQDRVFDFAFTTREGGNGLGLAMVHQCIVEDHGGRVSLSSAPGAGTRVEIRLPLAAEGEATA